MSQSLSRRFAVLNGLVVVALVSIVAVFSLLSLDRGRMEPKLAANLLYAPLMLLLALIGGLIVSHRPNHRIGVGMCLVATTASLLGVAEAYVEYDLFVQPHALPFTDIAAWFYSWLWIWVLMPPITILLLVCPDGQLPSRRWRPALIFQVAALLLLTVSQAFHAGPFEDFPTITNPFGVEAIDPLLEAANALGFLLLLPAIAVAVFALIGRFRRSHGVERQQLKWFAFAAAGALGVFIISWGISLASDSDAVWDYSTVLAVSLFPIATGIAILRHNLYDIDRVINRALVYAVLTAGLALTYFGLVVGLETLLQPVSGGSDLAIVVTTLVVAALFLPARQRVQDAIDRRFNRRAYDAARTIDAFSARLRQEIDLDTLRYELLAVVDETMQPAKASLWLRRT
jgi:hypothetical protein